MKIIALLFSFAAVLVLAGCGGGADTSKPVGEVQQDSETMSVAQLQAKATDFQQAIEAKARELEPLQKKLGELPMTQMMGTEAQALQKDILEVTKELNDLKDRLAVYVNALEAKGESVSEYAL